MFLVNGAEGGTNGVTVSAVNSGGASGNAFDTASPGSFPKFSKNASYTGSFSYKLATNFNGLSWSRDSSSTDWYTRAYINVPSFAASASLFGVSAPYTSVWAGTVGLLGQGDGTARLHVRSAGYAHLATGTYVVTAATWYRVELHISNVVAGYVEAYLYDKAGNQLDYIKSATTDQSADAGYTGTEWFFGDAAGVATALPYYLDCLAASDGTTFIGAVAESKSGWAADPRWENPQVYPPGKEPGITATGDDRAHG